MTKAKDAQNQGVQMVDEGEEPSRTSSIRCMPPPSIAPEVPRELCVERDSLWDL